MKLNDAYFLEGKLWPTSVQLSSVTQSCPTPCDPMNCNMPGLPVHHQPPGSTQTHVHRVGDAILCRCFVILPSIFPSNRVLSNESALCIRWPKYWSFSFSISPSNEHPGLISFIMDWLDLLAVQGDSQESSPTWQFKSINSSVLSFLDSPTLIRTGKTIALTRWTFVDKVTSLLLICCLGWS